MKILLSLFLTVVLIHAPSLCQLDMKDYEPGWIGEFKDPNAFQFTIDILQKNKTDYSIKISNAIVSATQYFKIKEDGLFTVSFDNNLSLTGRVENNLGRIRAFVKSGMSQYHLTLKKSGEKKYSGVWNMMLVKHLNPQFFLNIENGSRISFQAYAVFGDSRLPRFMNYNFEQSHDSIYFDDARTGLHFSAKLYLQKFLLNFHLFGKVITSVEVTRQKDQWVPVNNFGKTLFDNHAPQFLRDGWKVSDIVKAHLNGTYLQRMVDSINENAITNTHSVLIARDGSIVFEKYFAGYDSGIPHDMRSASKSISSALVGIAVDKGVIQNENQKIFDLLPEQYRYAASNDDKKAKITIKDLLTMSSGLDAVDFGIERASAAAEDTYQNTNDWTRTILEAPMINEPGTHANYGSANPFLLGVILDTLLRQQLEIFMDDNLFAPLGISNYIVQNDMNNRPYFGGGMFLTPRDMLKFGQLYLDNGKWKGRQIISEDWVKHSFEKYHILENHNEKNEYGYLWWHYSYTVNSKTTETVEARGAGGQYIFLIPAYNMVVVVTSGNFRNGRVWQPEKIIENYILPAVMGE